MATWKRRDVQFQIERKRNHTFKAATKPNEDRSRDICVSDVEL